jgi:hypothetical protein
MTAVLETPKTIDRTCRTCGTHFTIAAKRGRPAVNCNNCKKIGLLSN